MRLQQRPVRRWNCVGPPARAAVAVLLAVLFASPLRAEVPYSTEISGTDDQQLVKELDGVSQLVTLKDKPPDSEAALNRRAAEDLPRLKRVVESQGYWEGNVDFTVDFSAKPAKVTLKVMPGPQYKLQRITLVTPDGGPVPDIATFDPAVFGLTLGDPAKSAPVLDAERKITDEYARRGRPFAKVVGRKAVVDVATKTMSVTYTVEAGSPAKFGPVAVDGLSKLGEGYVTRRITWQEGQDYDQRTVEGTRKSLVDSGLFSSVRIDHADQLTGAGEVPMRISLVERPRRSLGAGLSYNTSQGFGVNGFWENRNLFGEAEKLHIDVDVAQQRRDIRANFRKPDFLSTNQDLTTLAEITYENPVAYSARRKLVFPGVERRFDGIYAAGGGVQVQHTTVTEAARDIKRTYSLAGIPLFLRRDTRDDILNPQQGSHATLMVTPSRSLSGESLNFVTSRFDGGVYRRIGENDHYVAAGFLGLGSIIGESRDGLPADQRLYAGGGGSLRGYAYQLAGPLIGDKPLGGRSLLQFGTELRIKVTDTIGVVPFVEAGNVYEKSYPSGGGLLYDAGIGLRYYTPVGPVRFDIATPLRRRSADGIVQIYISIGQAF
jgi:translocation and assembly module TamA